MESLVRAAPCSIIQLSLVPKFNYIWFKLICKSEIVHFDENDLACVCLCVCVRMRECVCLWVCGLGHVNIL